MGWIFAGFVAAILFETVIRVLSNYSPEPESKERKVRVSFPWYGWGLVSYDILKNKKRGK